MVFRVGILFSLFILFGCKTTKSINSETAWKSVELNMFIRSPHCGGAILDINDNGRTSPMTHASYNIVQISDSISIADPHELDLVVKTDGEGKVQLSLKNGTYQLFHPDKKLSFDAFLKKTRRDNDYYKSHPDDCYKKWQVMPDFKFEVRSDTIIDLTEYRRCFTKNNPCINYIGPLPP